MTTPTRIHAVLAATALLSLQALAVAPAPERVSKGSGGALADSHCYEGSASASGRWVAFDSGATNLGLPNAGGDFQVYLVDRKTGDSVHVSKSADGQTAGNGDSYCPVLSANGRLLAYFSDSDNMVAEDADSENDLYLYDAKTGAHTVLLQDADGGPANGGAEIYGQAMTPNGRYLAFKSTASNLAPGTEGGNFQVYLLDLRTGAVTLLSADDAGNPGNGSSESPSISANGRFVVFESLANNLVAGDGNGQRDVFVRDIRKGTTTRVSVPGAGGEANGPSREAVVANDGKVVAFRSFASNLVSGDGNSRFDIFVRDGRAGTTTRISVDEDGAEADGHSYQVAMSANGKTLVYYSYATNLVKNVPAPEGGVYRHDRRKGTTLQLDLGPGGEVSEHDIYVYAGSLTSTGKWLVMGSGSTALAGTDTLGQLQAYLVRVR